MAALPPIVSQNTAVTRGFELPEDALLRASDRIRGQLRQDVTAVQDDTCTARGPKFRLPQWPVTAVASVVDDDNNPVTYQVRGSILEVDTTGFVTVTYNHGYAAADMPGELIEFVCQVATRLATPVNAELAAGITQQGAGGFSISFGMDAYKAVSGLTQGEKETLARIWPALPQIINVGRPA